MDGFEVVRVEGTPYEMGYQHGRQCKDKICQLLKEGLPTEITRFGKVDVTALRKKVREYEPYIRSFAPHLIEEIKGIADGAGLEYEEALVLQCRGELVYRARGEAECTSFALSRVQTGENQVVVGQNVDLGAGLEKSGIILCLYPKDGHAIMTWTLAGTLGQVGINSAGLARSGNLLVCPGWRVGLPTTILWRRILEQGSVTEAVEIIGRAHRAKSNAFVLGDRNDHVLMVETTVERWRMLEAKDGLLVHTNHYLHPDFLSDERFYDLAESRARLARLKELFTHASRPITIRQLRRFLRDHSGYPDSICKHPKGSGDAKTVASIIMYPESGVIEACTGNPCEGNYARYQL